MRSENVLLHGPSPRSKGPWQDHHYELFWFYEEVFIFQMMCVYIYVVCMYESQRFHTSFGVAL